MIASAVGCSSPANQEAPGSTRSASVASSSFTPTLGPADVLSPTSPWYKDVSSEPVASNSGSMLAATRFGHGNPQIDFGLSIMQIGPSTPHTSALFNPTYTPDSDSTAVPVPTGGAVEGEAGYTCTQGGDCHLLIIDPTQRKAFELWHANNTAADGSGTWSADDETVWLMDGQYGPQGRGLGCTSADAAGLSIMAGIIGLREANAGQINHALRFILPNSQIRKHDACIAPATHGTSATTSVVGLPYGARLRLKASFDASKVASKGGQAVIRALQRYGMFLADGGQDAFVAEAPDFYQAEGLSWNGVLARGDLSALQPTDFEVVDYSEGALESGNADCVRLPDPPTVPRGGGSSSGGSSSGGSSSGGSSSGGSSSGGSSSGGSSSGGSSSGGSSSGGSSSGGSSSGGGTGGVVLPAGAGPNALKDPGFESDVNGFGVWPSDASIGFTKTAIDGSASLELTLPSGDSAFTSRGGGGTGAVHVTAKVRNDGSTPASVTMCVGFYDQNWHDDQVCSPLTLAPGIVTPVSAVLAIPAGTSAYMTTWSFKAASAATLAIDDAYLGFAPN